MTRAKTTDDPADPRIGKQRLARHLGLVRPHRRAVGAEPAPDGVRLDGVRVVLVRTEFAGNLGRTARAMLNMGLTDLRLVRPRFKHLSSDARRPAGHSWEVIKHAQVVDSLDEALADTVFSVGLTSARERARYRVEPFEDVLPRLAEASRQGPVALVFGSEADGMRNEEIGRCTVAAQLACSPESPVLNLAQAVLLACANVFTWRRPAEAPPSLAPDRDPVSHQQLEGYFAQLLALLDRVRFSKKQRADRFEASVRRIFTKSPLDAWEVALLRGMLTAFESAIDHPERAAPKADVDGGKADGKSNRGSGKERSRGKGAVGEKDKDKDRDRA